MGIGEYFGIIALQNNRYEKVHHYERHEKLKDREKYVTIRRAAT